MCSVLDEVSLGIHSAVNLDAGLLEFVYGSITSFFVADSFSSRQIGRAPIIYVVMKEREKTVCAATGCRLGSCSPPH